MNWLDEVHWPTVWVAVGMVLVISIVLGILARR
jgi:hypothetical protein